MSAQHCNDRCSIQRESLLFLRVTTTADFQRQANRQGDPHISKDILNKFHTGNESLIPILTCLNLLNYCYKKISQYHLP